MSEDNTNELVVYGVRQKAVSGKETTVWINGSNVGSVPHKGVAKFRIDGDCTVEFRLENGGIAVAYVKKDDPGVVQLFGTFRELEAKQFASEAEIEAAEADYNKTKSYGAQVKSNFKWLLIQWLAILVVGGIILAIIFSK